MRTGFYKRKNSPRGSVGRTFRLTLEFPEEMRKLQVKKVRVKRTYRNPVFVAMEWQAMIDSGECETRADLSRKLGVSRARVTQVLNLLNMDKRKLKAIVKMGDALSFSKRITERNLRDSNYQTKKG